MPKVELFDKEDVIRKALNVFHSKGYNLTSMQDLVDATGLSRSSIYNSFENKLVLYKECLKSYKIDSNNMIQGSLNASNCVFNNIKSIFFIGISTDKEFMSKGCLFNNCTSEMANQEESIKIIMMSNQEEMIQLFTNIVEKGQEQKLINKLKTAREYGLYLLTSFQGLRISGILLHDQKELESIVNTTLSVLN